MAAPILFGVYKFFYWMTFWPKYRWVGFPHFLSVSPQHFMYGVGVLLLPRIASYAVAGWLGGIITNTIIVSIATGGHTHVFWDIALRNFGLLLAALALARLAAAAFAPKRLFHSRRTAEGRQRVSRACCARRLDQPIRDQPSVLSTGFSGVDPTSAYAAYARWSDAGGPHAAPSRGRLFTG